MELNLCCALFFLKGVLRPYLHGVHFPNGDFHFDVLHVSKVTLWPEKESSST